MQFVPPGAAGAAAAAVDTTMIPLPGQTRQRLLELRMRFEGADAVATAALAEAQRHADRYNDALAAVKDALGVAQDADLDVDFAGGMLVIRTAAAPEPEADPDGGDA